MSTADILAALTSAQLAAARQSSLRRRTPRVPSEQNQTVQRLAAHWNTLDGTQRGTYETLLRQLNSTSTAQPGQPTPPYANAYALYIQCATAVVAQGGPLPTQAPNYESLAPLPPVRVDASFVNGGVVLKLIPDTAYASKVLVYGVKPILPGQNIISARAYKPLGAIAHIQSGMDISALYNSRFNTSAQGFQINLKLVGVTDGGLKTNALYTEGIAFAPTELSVSVEDDSLPPGILKITNLTPSKRRAG